MLQKHDLVKLATVKMPFGKYQGRVICDLPEEYLLWFNKKGFPEGELGLLLQYQLELHIHGLTGLVHELKRRLSQSSY